MPFRNQHQLDHDLMYPINSSSRSQRPPSSVSLPGIANLGNTCFMNSILQALHATRPLSDLLNLNCSNLTQPITPLQLLIRNHPHHPHSSHLPILLQLSKFFHQFSITHSGALKPIGLLKSIASHHPHYRRKDQQDAHEFLRILMDLIRSEEANFIKHCSDSNLLHSSSFESTSILNSNQSNLSNGPDTHSLRVPTPILSSSSSSSSSSASSSSFTSSTSIPDSSLLDSLFSGSLTQYTVCEKFHVSSVQEGFLDLSLATPHPDPSMSKRARLRQKFGRLNKSKPSSTPPSSPLPSHDDWEQVFLGGSSAPNSSAYRPPVRSLTISGTSTRRHRTSRPFLCSSFSGSSLNLISLQDATSLVAPSSPGSSPPLDLLARILSPTAPARTPPPPPPPATGLRALRFSQPNPLLSKVGLLGSNPNKVSETGLEALLKSFTSIERLEGENRFACEACASESASSSSSSDPSSNETDSSTPKVVLRRAWKRYLISNLPPIVVFHLKRSSSNDLSHSGQAVISFPIKLDFKPFLCPTSDDQAVIYGLYAVIVHKGVDNGGHYFCYVLSDHAGSSERSWLYCSDTEVRRVKVEEVMSAKAYMLFYEQL
ncbi:ubiquitin C-terminal hydrolase [Melampsora americana]|nr:ubiquitin C-terminal hydrolase [Melampsora americana]